MRCWCCMVVGAFVVAVVAALWGGLSAGGAGFQPAAGTLPPGLVREEDVYPEDQEDALEQLGRLPVLAVPRGAGMSAGGGGGVGFATRLNAWLSAWLRIDELQRELQRPRQRAGSSDWAPPAGLAGAGAPGSDAHTLPPLPTSATLEDLQHIEDLRNMVRRSLLFVAMAVKATGALLLVVAPMTCFAYGTLDFFFREQGALLPQRLLGGFMQPLDQRLQPLLVVTAQVLGLDRAEVLCERGDSPEGARRVKRVLLGLMVLNVVSSGLAMLVLALLVFLVRTWGILP